MQVTHHLQNLVNVFGFAICSSDLCIPHSGMLEARFNRYAAFPQPDVSKQQAEFIFTAAKLPEQMDSCGCNEQSSRAKVENVIGGLYVCCVGVMLALYLWNSCCNIMALVF